MFRGLPPTLLFLILLVFFSFTSTKAQSNHLIITQIQVASTQSANYEFVEIYNPMETDQNLTDLRLTRTNSTGTTVQNLIASMSGTLASHHYLLIAHPGYTTIPTTPDKTYSASSSGITTNSSIILYDTDHSTVIDKVGFGTATNFETSPAPNPPSDQTLVRTGFIDTDNNNVDFTISVSPILHNSAFVNDVPTDTSTPTPSPFSSPEPTAEAALPTPSPVPPTPTIQPQPTVAPTLIPTPTPKHIYLPKPIHHFNKFIISCHHFIQKFHWPRFHR